MKILGLAVVLVCAVSVSGFASPAPAPPASFLSAPVAFIALEGGALAATARKPSLQAFIEKGFRHVQREGWEKVNDNLWSYRVTINKRAVVYRFVRQEVKGAPVVVLAGLSINGVPQEGKALFDAFRQLTEFI